MVVCTPDHNNGRLFHYWKQNKVSTKQYEKFCFIQEILSHEYHGRKFTLLGVSSGSVFYIQGTAVLIADSQKTKGMRSDLSTSGDTTKAKHKTLALFFKYPWLYLKPSKKIKEIIHVKKQLFWVQYQNLTTCSRTGGSDMLQLHWLCYLWLMVEQVNAHSNL